MSRHDRILLLSLLCLALLVLGVLLLIHACGRQTDGVLCAVVTCDGRELAVLPLDRDCDYPIVTESGSNLLRIRDGQARVVEADCPDKICIRTGVLTDLTPLVCLPHKLIITLETRPQADVTDPAEARGQINASDRAQVEGGRP